MKREWKVYEEKLGLWAPYFKPFWESGEFDELTDAIQARAKRHHKIIPDSSLTYRVFQEVPPKKVKVFIFGLCPYHTAVEKITVADGLALSCSRTGVCQPSLEQYYDAIEKEFEDGLCLPCNRNPDLKFLADQGVFLGNVSLTTEYLKVFRHGEIWEKFTEFFLDKVVSMEFSNVPVIFLGKEAQKFYPYLALFQWQFLISHPASASYSGDVWDSEGTFKRVNEILRNQKKEEIQWIQTS